MRLFIGIPLPSATRDVLLALTMRLRAHGDPLRWSAVEGWHITLQFLGASTPQQCAAVIQALSALRAAPFSLELAAPDVFDRAGVFHVGVRLSPALTALQQSVVAATQPCGYVPEARPYRPHITLARSKTGPAPLRALQARLGTPPSFAPFRVTEFLLYESFLRSGGSHYEVRAHFPLAPAVA